MADDSRSQLLADVKSLCATGDFSDLTIICGDDKYSVHKNIVCCRSTVFAKAINFPGKEQEDKTIDLSENEPAIVQLLVQYLYEAEYDPIIPVPQNASDQQPDRQTLSHSCTKKSKGYHCNYGYDNNRRVCPHHYCGNQCDFNCVDFFCEICLLLDGDADQLLTHAKMYEMADKYDIAGLKPLCIEKYRLACLKFWNDTKFAESAYHVYCTTPTRDKGLRTIVCKTISDHMALLRKPEVEDLMTEFNGLAFGLLFDKAEQAGWCK